VSTDVSPNRGGAPAGNRNRMQSGLSAVRGWLTIGSLPKGASYIRRTLGRMRTELESAVLAMHGEITPYHAALIQSATRHEARSMLAGRWLRLEGAKASLADRLSLLATVTNASDARDKCLEKLGLDKRPGANPWAALDADSREPAAPAERAEPDIPPPLGEAPAADGLQAASAPNATAGRVGAANILRHAVDNRHKNGDGATEGQQ